MTPALSPLQAQPGGPDFSFFLMMGAIFAIFYFLVIRPQQKQQKERDAFLRTAARGDSVVTAGGLHGKVAAVEVSTLPFARACAAAKTSDSRRQNAHA